MSDAAGDVERGRPRRVALLTCLLFGLALLGLWGRSQFAHDSLQYEWLGATGSSGHDTAVAILSYEGALGVASLSRSNSPLPYRGPSGWRFESAHPAGTGFSDPGHWGFRLLFRRINQEGGRAPITRIVISAPYWFLAAVALIYPAAVARRRLVAGRRMRQGRCVRCGYDVRVSAGQCPECGINLCASTRRAQLNVQNVAR